MHILEPLKNDDLPLEGWDAYKPSRWSYLVALLALLIMGPLFIGLQIFVQGQTLWSIPILVVMFVGLSSWAGVVNKFWIPARLSSEDLEARTWRQWRKIPLARIAQVSEVKYKTRAASLSVIVVQYVDQGEIRVMRLPSGLRHDGKELIEVLKNIVEENDRRTKSMIESSKKTLQLEDVVGEREVGILVNAAPLIVIGLFAFSQMIRSVFLIAM